MDVLMDCYFEEIFKNLDRDCLFSRAKRRELVQYFWTVIAGCARGDLILYSKTQIILF